MALTVNTRQVGDVAVVDLDGKITLGESTGHLRESIRQLLEQGTKKIVLNVAKVSYVDSAGLGELVGIYTTAKNQAATVKLINLQKKMTDLLQITRLHTIFEIYENEQAALDSFGKSVTA
jgi:anti-sigma B factor antagonist